MFVSQVRLATGFVAAVAAVPILIVAAAQPSRRDADQMRQKVAAIMQLSERPRRETSSESRLRTNVKISSQAHNGEDPAIGRVNEKFRQ